MTDSRHPESPMSDDIGDHGEVLPDFFSRRGVVLSCGFAMWAVFQIGVGAFNVKNCPAEKMIPFYLISKSIFKLFWPVFHVFFSVSGTATLAGMWTMGLQRCFSSGGRIHSILRRSVAVLALFRVVWFVVGFYYLLSSGGQQSDKIACDYCDFTTNAVASVAIVLFLPFEMAVFLHAEGLCLE